MSKWKFVAIGVLCAGSLHAGWFSSGLGTGILAGGQGSVHTVHTHVSAQQVETGSNESHLWHDDLTGRAEGGGISVGYGAPICQRFRLALMFDGNWASASTIFADNNGDVEDNVLVRSRVENFYDLALEPGAMVGSCTLLYAKVGVTWTELQHTLLGLNDDPPYNVEVRNRAAKTCTGYVLGAGARVAISSWLSAFAQYDWRAYPDSSITLRGADPAYALRSTLGGLHSTSFSLGLMVSI